MSLYKIDFGGNLLLDGVIEGFTNLDFISVLDKKESLTGSLFTILGSAMKWKANLQLIVTLPTIEVEYIIVKEEI